MQETAFSVVEVIDTRDWSVQFAENLTNSVYFLAAAQSSSAVFFAGGFDVPSVGTISDAIDIFTCGNDVRF